MELAGSRAALAERASELARAEADKNVALRSWQEAEAARMEAEASEKRALTAAARQVSAMQVPCILLVRGYPNPMHPTGARLSKSHASYWC